MKQILFTLTITLFISLNCSSQIRYQKGYFIDNNDEKTACLIKNEYWKQNPTKITIKFSANDRPATKTIASIKEFGINEEIKYERATVNIDTSSASLDALDNKRNPNFIEEQVFLNVLVEGKASLYIYDSGNSQRFFFKTEDSNIEQLIFKNYLKERNQIAQNNQYKQQLLNNLKCPGISSRDIQNLRYRKNKLVNLFIKYNNCSDVPFSRFSEDQNKFPFVYYLKAGVTNSSLEVKNLTTPSRSTDFDNQFGYRIGVESEVILYNKWSLLAEPTYQNFVAKKEEGIYTSGVSYHAILLPLGVRHYMYLNENSSLFINGLVIWDVVDLGSEFKSWRPSSTFENSKGLGLKTGINFGLGLGFNFNKRYSAELRYHTDRSLLLNAVSWHAEYSNLSLIFGYSLF